jgi:predicted dehydrogenase
MAELTVGVLGCGPAGQIHLRAWAIQTGVRVVAVCDTNGVLAAQTAAQYPDVAAFVDAQQMFASDSFDIIDICTPPSQHAPLVELALRAGSNVLCEKPLATDPKQAFALAQLASDRERLLSVFFCHRFHPPIRFARELVENDDLGRLLMFRFRLSGYWTEAEHRHAGINALYDTAIHGMDLFRAFAGEATSICGKLLKANPTLTLEDTVALLLQSERGVLGSVEASWSTPGGRSVLELYGTAGACLVDYDTGELRYYTADQPIWQTREVGGPNRFESQLAHFADAVRGLQPLEATGEDGARAVELCAQVAPA